MGTCSVERSESLTVIRFTAFTEAGGAMWPAAIVAWRGAEPSPQRGWRAKWRAFRYRRGFDPLHAPFTFGGDAGLWMGYAGPEGERESLFHARRHVVRVLDREFAVRAPGETLVLLIDDSAPTADAQLMTRVIVGKRVKLEQGVAISATVSSEPLADPADPLVTLSRNDPEVRRFLYSMG